MNDDENSIARRETITEFSKEWSALENNLQNVSTPFELVYNMIERLKEHTEFEHKTFCVFNLEFIEALHYGFNVPLEKIWFFTDCEHKEGFLKACGSYEGVNIMRKDFNEILKKKNNEKKFDVVAMNPPYNAPKIKRQDDNNYTGRNAILWDKFVLKALELLKEDAILCAVHPSKWRRPDKKNKILNVFKEKQLHYLEIHDFEDGVKTFNCQTRYDWYIFQNIKNNKKTTIKDQQGISYEINIRDLGFIPNFLINDVIKLLAKGTEERIKILYDCAYHHQHNIMNKNISDTHKYPCVWAIDKNNNPSFYYSNTNELGHFGIPKVIIPSGHYCSVGLIADEDGKYGMTEFAKGIVDEPENLNNIVKAMQTEKFKEIAMAISTATTELDRITLSYFRKDFWKEFI